MKDPLVPGPPLVCSATSFVIDAVLIDAVDVEYAKTPLHNPTTDPNRYTIHVPTETTRLSLGQKSTRWTTDIGITGYTDSHVHFETRVHDKTVMSLGGPATMSGISGHVPKPPKPKEGEPAAPAAPAAPVQTNGYSMVTEKNAWHEATLQHHLLSQKEDMSLRTMGAGKRAVVQADEGKIDFNGGVQVNVSGGGVSIAAGPLHMEKKGYDKPWVGARPHSSAAGGTRIAAAVAAALSAVADVIINKPRTKYGEGDFAGAPEERADKHKRKINGALLVAALYKVGTLLAAPESPEKCVKLDAEESLTAMAGDTISIFATKGANLGSACWTSVTAGMSASLKGTAFAGVGAMFASMKGYRKVEMGSDWGKVFVGAEKEIALVGEEGFAAGGENVAHVASPSATGQALFGAKKVWMGTSAGGGWGLLLDDEGLALGKATGAAEMDTATIAEVPALRINPTRVTLRTATTMVKLEGNLCTVSAKNAKILFNAGSGPVTLCGSKILLK